MRKEAELWVEDAEYDIGCAKDMLSKKRYNYAVFLSRQSVEKMLKASYLYIIKKPFPKEHNLITIAKTIFKTVENKIMDDIIFLNPHYTITRYVDSALDIPSRLYNKGFAEECIKKAEEVNRWIKKKMH